MGIMVRDRPSQESALIESGCRNFLHSGALQPEPQLPCGWEKCLDLKSGLIYYKDWNSGTMTYRDPRQRVRRVWMESSATETTTPSTTASLQITTDDEEQSLELSLNLPGSKSSGAAVAPTNKNLPVVPSSNQEESVCTMEKVRMALDRLSNRNNKKRSVSSSRESNSPTTSNSSTNSECFTSPSAMSYEGDDEEVQQQPRQRQTAPSKVAVAVVPEVKMSIVGCKSCLMYVMLWKSNPCCPKCGNTDVLLELPKAPASKKQRTLESSSPTTWSWCTA